MEMFSGPYRVAGLNEVNLNVCNYLLSLFVSFGEAHNWWYSMLSLGSEFKDHSK